MKFYGRPAVAHYTANVEAVVVVKKLLEKDGCIAIPEDALREVSMLPMFSDFAPKEIEAAIAEARTVQSTILTLDATTYKDAAEEAAALGS